MQRLDKKIYKRDTRNSFSYNKRQYIMISYNKKRYNMI